LATTLCLQYEARTIALAALRRMAQQSEFLLPLPAGMTFNEFFGVTQADLDGKLPLQAWTRAWKPCGVNAHPKPLLRSRSLLAMSNPMRRRPVRVSSHNRSMALCATMLLWA
jgi:hypothetical protein